MDDRLFEEMLKEIDAMTPGEYWSLYREAEKLADFPPEVSSFIPVQFITIPAVNLHQSLDRVFGMEVISTSQNYCQETSWYGDDVWPKAA
jgi:hypothetical protein